MTFTEFSGNTVFQSFRFNGLLKPLIFLGLLFAIFMPVTAIYAQEPPVATCVDNGTLIWKEDFGGLDGDPQRAPDPGWKQAGITTYDYVSRTEFMLPDAGQYALLKYTHGTAWSYYFGDHTTPSDDNTGYFLTFDATSAEGEFFNFNISDLCAGSVLTLSAWLMNINPLSWNPTNPPLYPPNVIFLIEDNNGNQLESYSTGDIGRQSSATWVNYAFPFKVPEGITTLKVRFINNQSQSGYGNDIAIDDIEVRFCAPPVNINLSSTVCADSSFTLKGSYTDDGTFGSALTYRWEYSATGDRYKPDEWSVVEDTQGTSDDGTVNDVHTIYSASSAAHAGYYRFVVANADNIDKNNCRATSDIVQLQVATGAIPGMVSIDQTICYNTTATLTSATATGKNIIYHWEQSIDGGYTWESVSAGTGGTALYKYTSPALTQTTKFRLMVNEGTGVCTPAYSDTITVTVDPLCVHDEYVTTSCDAMPLVIPVLTDNAISPDCLATAVVTVIDPPKNGTAKPNTNNKIVYTADCSGLDSLTYRVTCNDNGETSEAKVYITVNAASSAFADNVWYYGRNSQGIRFVNNGSGGYTARDASGKSQVDSHENSLVVSSPYCDGQLLFYASHNQLYNSLHEKMSNGSFEGNSSVADGLAACYMGNNKYLLFSVTNANEYDGGKKGLNAYTVDMNADHGRGAITGEAIEIVEASSNMSESIELIAASEPDLYWLIYAYYNGSHYELRVRKVDVSSGAPVIKTTVSNSIATSNTSSGVHTYTLKASPQNNRIAIAHSDNKTVDVFDFDNVTGKLSNLRTTPSNHHIDGLAYGVEFSPDGNQLYAAGYTTTNGESPMLRQYTITSNSLIYVSGIQYWNYSGSDGSSRGGGLKLGPDGKIYVALAYDKHVGVINDPNSMNLSLSNGRYSTMELNYDPASFAQQFSTGLTKPTRIECNTNTAPVVQSDGVELCLNTVSRTAKVNVLKNDSDPDADNVVYLTGAGFVNAADAALASLTVNAADSTVSMRVKPDAHINVVGKVFEIDYHVKDNGIPASQCATGRLKVTAYPTTNYSDFRVYVCPDAGDINLAKYIDIADMETTLEWTYKIPAGIVSGSIFPTSALASSRIHTLAYTVSNRCVGSQTRKVYIEILKNGVSRQPRDTIAICQLYAEAVNINQLFGLEAGGTWTYNTVGGSGDISACVTESPSSSIYAGAVVMNGKAIYENPDIPTGTYHGVEGVKMVKFTYTSADVGCLAGKSYSMVIVLTEDIKL